MDGKGCKESSLLSRICTTKDTHLSDLFDERRDLADKFDSIQVTQWDVCQKIPGSDGHLISEIQASLHSQTFLVWIH